MKAKITNCIHESVIKNTYLKLLCLYPLIWYLFQPHFNKINVESHLYKEFTLGFLGRAITRRLDTCATYAIACQEVANINEVSFVNLYEAMLMQKSFPFQNWESFLSDGLHFSRKGSEFLARILENLLTDKLGDLKWWFPDWKVINPNDPAEFISHYLQSQM
ncbi:uncharacterized protein DC041_0006031 [Schistosoma bovis]|uniref:Uncharacterized protein n=1 Tax=Schistosoma bovis TaxID=6184 RepID=A0A430QQC3_SCHBO|nr:uncharacterized protein DC041_0006031 [Schistosoma bovis]